MTDNGETPHSGVVRAGIPHLTSLPPETLGGVNMQKSYGRTNTRDGRRKERAETLRRRQVRAAKYLGV